MQKRVVILGGAGLIGTHLCLRLLKEGHEVFCVDVREKNDSPLLRQAYSHDAFHFIHHNIIHSFGIRCDEIYNLASPSCLSYDKTLPVETLKVNISGSMNALETARAEHARVLYASSGDVYGLSRRDSLSEEGYFGGMGTVLGDAKRAAEALHKAYRMEYGTDTRIARIFNVYGPGADLADQRVIMKMTVAALRNRDILIYGSGEQTRTFCWVEDAVEGLIRLMAAPEGEATPTVNIGSMHEISMRALAELIIHLTDSRSKIIHIDARSYDMRRKTPDISTARQLLQWTPSVPLTEGLQRTISYVRKELAKVSHALRSWVEVH